MESVPVAEERSDPLKAAPPFDNCTTTQKTSHPEKNEEAEPESSKSSIQRALLMFALCVCLPFSRPCLYIYLMLVY
jgi:hypothetical protein